jgi:hypothetical protein
MAWIVGDSFDYYGSTADVARSVWDSANTGFFPAFGAGASTRFGVGQSLRPQAAGVLMTKNLASNEATIFSCFAYYRGGALSGTTPEIYVQLRDGATAQCTVVMESSGNIVLKRGDQLGTVVATYPAAFAQDVWSHFQIRVVIDPTVGTFTVRKNGQPSDTFAATGLNTRSTANSYANVIALGMGTGVVNDYVDDLFFFSGSGAAPNTWVGDCRAVCLYPGQDSAVTFTPFPGTTGSFTPGGQSGTGPVVANQILWTRCAPVRGGACSTINASGQSAGMTGKAKLAVYNATTPGGPGALLGVSNEVTNPTQTQAFTFATPVQINAGQPIWVAILTDTNWTQWGVSSGYGTYYTLSQTYATGFPDPAPSGLTTVGPGSNSGAYHTINIAGNVVNVAEALADGDTTYNFSGTLNQEDLYEVANMPVTPAAIIGVVSKVYIKKSDAGTRQGMLRTRSGATDANGVDTAVSTTYTYLSRVDATDPATAAAWTLAGVNALKIGQKVTL